VCNCPSACHDRDPANSLTDRDALSKRTRVDPKIRVLDGCLSRSVREGTFWGTCANLLSAEKYWRIQWRTRTKVPKKICSAAAMQTVATITVEVVLVLVQCGRLSWLSVGFQSSVDICNRIV